MPSKQKPTIGPRKPPTDPAMAASFVAGNGASRPGVKSIGQQGSRPDHRHAAKRRLMIYLPVELAKRLRLRCAEEDRDQSDAITEAVQTWLCGCVAKPSERLG